MKVDKYSLSIRRGNNNYYPVEWKYLTENKVNDEYNLEEIDNFTTSLSEGEIKYKLIEGNYINEYEVSCPFIIIYYEKDNIRILNDGVLFINDKEALNKSFIINYLIENINNRQLMNKIYNSINKYNKDNPKLDEFLYVINKTKEITENLVPKKILDTFSKLDYIDRRRIGVYIIKNLV